MQIQRQIPKGAQCSRHPERMAVAKFRWRHSGVTENCNVCLACGDAWWSKFGETPVAKTLVILELTKDDLK